MRLKKSLLQEYYVCLPEEKEPIPLNQLIPEHKFKLDYNLEYFSKIFEVMEKSLEIDNLVFYLTRNIHQLPSYGPNVIAIVLGDEWCRIPSYVHKVHAVFKCYGTQPILGCNPITKPSYLNFMTLIKFIRTLVIRLPSLLNYTLNKSSNWPNNKVKKLLIYDIPLGYYKQWQLPVKDIEQRPYDVFFSGSMVSIPDSLWSLKYWLSTPKKLSRRKMISAINAVKEKLPKFNIELSTTYSFHSTTNEDTRYYSERMMDTKICLVPRGTSFETFRFFEGLRSGCIVVTESLPSRWFYDGAPVIQIKDWSELEGILEKLLNNKSLLQEKHQQSLNWWQHKCSEAAVGAYMAEKLNATRLA
ncbi:MAG: exostosin family protein [Symploca sp. SIO2G7]|nr:exostosin family protein [Symploca sp. SIO2G7]